MENCIGSKPLDKKEQTMMYYYSLMTPWSVNQKLITIIIIKSWHSCGDLETSLLIR